MNVKSIKGLPTFTSGQFLGYILWKRSDGFHLRWTTKGKKANHFQGKISSQTKIKITKKARSETAENIKETDKNIIEWNTTLQDQMDGLDFLTAGNFTLELRINKKKVKSKSIFLGPQMIEPESNPFNITQLTAEKKVEITKIKPKELKKIEKVKEIVPEPEPIYEPTPEPEPEPVYEPTPEPEPEPVYEPTPEPEPEPIYEPTPELEVDVGEKIEDELNSRLGTWLNQLVTHRKVVMVEKLEKPATEQVYEPVSEPEPEPMWQPEPEPTPEPVYEHLPEPEPEPVWQTEPEPISEPVYEHMPEPEHETMWQPEPEPTPEPVYEHLPEPEPEPVWQPEPEPESKPEYEDLPEPKPEVEKDVEEEKSETESPD